MPNVKATCLSSRPLLAGLFTGLDVSMGANSFLSVTHFIARSILRSSLSKLCRHVVVGEVGILSVHHGLVFVSKDLTHLL